MTTDGATMLGGLTHLFASNPALLLIIPALLLILALILKTRHGLKVSELGYNLKKAVIRWQDALDKVQDQQILKQPNVIKHRPDEYDDLSRVKYEEAQKTWATWLSQRQKLEQRLAEAGHLQKQMQSAAWWKFPLGKLKKSTRVLLEGAVQFSVGTEPLFELSAEEFLPAVLSSANKSRELADSFAAAFKNAADSLSKLNRAVDGTTGSPGTGLLGQKSKLLALDLPFEPYTVRLDAVLKTRSQLNITLTRQPLSSYAPAVSDLLIRIAKLEKDLTFACSMHAVGLSTAAKLKELDARLSELRSSSVPSGVPGVEIEGLWRLDEEAFAPEPFINQAVRQCADFGLALKGGDLTVLEKLERSAQGAIDQTSRILESTMAEKACFERQFAEITADCTEADLAADAETRQDCLKSYGAQKWAQARNACLTFSEAHKKRLAARDMGKRLIARMAEVTELVTANVDVSSAGCDGDFRQLVGLVGELSSEAKQGATEWDALRARMASVLESQAAGCVEAFVSRLNVEIDAHATAMAAVDKLSGDLRYTGQKTSDKWGGPSAKSTLESVTGSVEAAIASAVAKKQDWDALQQRVAEAGQLLAPALQLVQEEVRRDQLEYDRLSTLSGDIENCNTVPYTRTICGRVYGQGVYCPTVIPTQKLAVARELYQQRRYEEMAAALSTGRQILIAMHLDAWWLTLQILAFSPDSCARQFAQAEGYNSAGYDEWMEAQKKRSLQGVLFNLSEISCDKHQGQASAEQATGDAPNISDYTPGALVRR